MRGLNRTLLMAGMAVVMAGAAQAQSATLYCANKDAPTAFILTINYGTNTVTYYDQFQDGRRSDPITTVATISDTTIGWTQTEYWPWADREPHVVPYSLSRITGEVRYSWVETNGTPKNGQRNCVVNAKPLF